MEELGGEALSASPSFMENAMPRFRRYAAIEAEFTRMWLAGEKRAYIAAYFNMPDERTVGRLVYQLNLPLRQPQKGRNPHAYSRTRKASRQGPSEKGA